MALPLPASLLYPGRFFACATHMLTTARALHRYGKRVARETTAGLSPPVRLSSYSGRRLEEATGEKLVFNTAPVPSFLADLAAHDCS
jgi:hypothetical protein